MPSELLEIADAVVTMLNAAELSPSFVAARQYRPEFDLAEMRDLHVTVVPRGVEIAQAARGRTMYDYRVDIAVQQRITQETAEEIDPLVALVGEIAELFRARRLEGYPAAAWAKTEHVPIYSLEHLAELRQFTSVLTLTFRVVR